MTHGLRAALEPGRGSSAAARGSAGDQEHLLAGRGVEEQEAEILKCKEQLAIAEKRLASSHSESAKSLVKELKADLNRRELAMYSRRCDQNPEDIDSQYELGLRLKRAGNFAEATKCFQKSKL